MIGSLIIWIYMTFTIMIIGWESCKCIKRLTGYECHDFGIIWVIGLAIIAVYAQYFSIVSKVGAAANIVLILVCLVIVWFERKRIWADILSCYERIKTSLLGKKTVLFLFNFLLLLFLFICVTSQKAHHADTDLYHAQSIRWIEEYGVVKGLGNLHNRFAYNSSFMCLQALFSGYFLINQSTHVVNGYIAFVMCTYVMYLLCTTKRVRSSTWFQIAFMLYIFDKTTLSWISSPNTDMLSLSLVLFILMRWCKYVEDDEKNIVPYCMLCIIGLFSVTVKLSATMIMILLLKPAINLIKEKRGKEICLFVLLGIVIIAPFLVRNVMISGYLVYPYSTVDLFQVDWKMAKSVVDYDHKEIMVYARELYDYNLNNYSFIQWFPIWWNNQSNYSHTLFVINVWLFCFYIVSLIIDIRRKKVDWDNVLLFITVSALLSFWLLTAPSIRYGKVFFYGIPCVVLGNSLKFKNNKIFIFLLLLLYVGSISMLIFTVIEHKDEISLKRPAYYIYRECEELEWEGIPMYLAVENCYCGYYYLPASPYEHILDYIESRGTTIEDGFRVKEEMKQIKFNNSGRLY